MNLYAKWTEIKVTFDPNGGTMAANLPLTVTVDKTTGKVTNPTDDPTRKYTGYSAGLYIGAYGAYSFDGWYNENVQWRFEDPVLDKDVNDEGVLTLTAKWTEPSRVTTVSVNDVAAAVTYVNGNSNNSETYTLFMGSSEPSVTVTQTLEAGVNLTITGGRDIRYGTAGIQSSGSLFIIEKDASLTLLGADTALRGDCTSCLVQVNGTLIMKDNSVITGHTTDSEYGAVYVTNRGIFIMESGRISSCISNSTEDNATGGVYIGSGGTFIMNGGTISGNFANSEPADVYLENGSLPTIPDGADIVELVKEQ